ncbi:MAG: hypothetical protein JWO93_1231 [Micrococcaceae bacterium]|jgi:hypothetical protein|nr:hypothetical protein [Micrococcaceae bacterium]
MGTGSAWLMMTFVMDNPQASRFEVYDDGALAGFVRYRIRSNQMRFLSTEILATRRRRALLDLLLRQVMAEARDRRLAPAVLCPVLHAVVRRRHRDQAGAGRGAVRVPLLRRLTPGQALRNDLAEREQYDSLRLALALTDLSPREAWQAAARLHSNMSLPELERFLDGTGYLAGIDRDILAQALNRRLEQLDCPPLAAYSC